MQLAQREVLPAWQRSRSGGAKHCSELFGNAGARAPPPVTATELYVLWRTSVLAEQGYPARMALWTRERDGVRSWPLDSLEVRTPAARFMCRACSRCPIPW